MVVGGLGITDVRRWNTASKLPRASPVADVNLNVNCAYAKGLLLKKSPRRLVK